MSGVTLISGRMSGVLMRGLTPDPAQRLPFEST
jgi:hypothetical protein